jgi:hypothetical protein
MTVKVMRKYPREYASQRQTQIMPFDHLGPHTHRFDQLAIVQQRALILDIAAAQPRLDLIPHPLQLLDLRLEVVLELVLLRRVGRMVELVECGLEDLDAGGDGLERPVDLGWSGDGGAAQQRQIGCGGAR